MSKTQKTFEIYAAASPSGKIYVGMTSVSARRRWQAHVRRSQSCRNAHPLARAIAKYGAKSFTLHVICTASSEDEAKALEIAHIAELRSAEKRYGYNISRGGDYDAASGAAAMAERLKDSDFKASYLAKLSAVKKANDWSDYDAMVVFQRDWRKQNPKQAWAIGWRNIRLAVKAQNKPWRNTDPRFGSWGRLWMQSKRVEKARRVYFQRFATQGRWDSYSPNQREAIGAKISKTRKEIFKSDPSKLAVLLENGVKGRAAVDKKKQGSAASVGLKAYWARVKSDPIAYAKLMEGKIAKLKARSNV